MDPSLSRARLCGSSSRLIGPLGKATLRALTLAYGLAGETGIGVATDDGLKSQGLSCEYGAR